MELPRITRFLQSISAFLVEKRLLVLTGIFFVGFLLVIIFSTDTGQKVLFRFILSVPVL